MMRTYSVVRKRFVTAPDGMITGVEPVFVKEQMEYSDGDLRESFGYDTRQHSEADVDGMLARYPPFLSRMFGGFFSYLSRAIWRRQP